MDWREKSVTLGNVDKETFDTHLAHVTVSESRITVAYKDVEDWKRIRREVGTDLLLEQVALEDIHDIDTSEEHLYYPHINLTVATDDGETEKRIYFVEDEEDILHMCQKAIHRFWNAYRQRRAPRRDGYAYSGGEEAAEEVAGGETDEPDVKPPAPAEEEQEEVELEAALRQQNSLTHRLSEGIKAEAAHFRDILTGGTEEAETPAENEETDENEPSTPGTEQDEEAGQDGSRHEEAPEEKRGIAGRISDEIRGEIDKFRHVGKDGEKKEKKKDEEDETEEDERDEDEDGDEEQAGNSSPVEEVVDRFMDQ